MMRLHNPQPTTTASQRHWLATAVIALGATLIAGQQPLAQVSVGGSGLPNVSIDFSVVDALGPRISVPELLSGIRYDRGSRTAATPSRRAPRFPDIRHMKDGRPLGRVVLKPPSTLGTPVLRKPTLRKPTLKKPSKRRRAAPRAPVMAKPKMAAVRPAIRAPVAPLSIPLPPPPGIATAPMPAPQIPAPRVTARIAPPEIKPTVTVRPIPAKPVSPPKPPKQVASLPPAAKTIAAGASLRLTFPAGAARLTPKASQTLARVAKTLSEDSKLRLQLLAYAGGSSETASQARRLSLSRALTARSFLIGKGVRSTRIDVRALGNKSGGGPPDRIDVLVTKR